MDVPDLTSKIGDPDHTWQSNPEGFYVYTLEMCRVVGGGSLLIARRVSMLYTTLE